MNRFFRFCFVAIFALAGCRSGSDDWFDDYGTMTTGAPSQMQYGMLDYASTYGGGAGAAAHRMAVLLPMTGDNAAAGRTIQTSIETAVLQRGPQNLSVSFFDTGAGASDAIRDALNSGPEIIIGPLFAANARMLRDAKPVDVPVLSFTSDATAAGGGVMSMSLMPTNSVEAIIKEMKLDNIKSLLVVAPNTTSGQLMAGTARSAATIYDLPVAGVFYYTEKDSESIKNTAAAATMYTARKAANTRAREILSDVLTNETLTALEKSGMHQQLNNISKSDTLGKLPYDAVLFLGTGDDSKTLGSFMRYYGLGTHDARFYGTAMWDGSDIAADFTMGGSKFATLPPMSASFIDLYQRVNGDVPSRLASFGYDAANMAMGMMYSDKSNAAYLLDPSGYVGQDGLFRLKPTGESERALRIVETDGSGIVRDVRAAPQTFMTPLYNIEQRHITPARAMALETAGVNPLHYIKIPERLRGKYKSKTYGANTVAQTSAPVQENIIILPEDDRVAIVDPEYKPVSHETVGRTYIDSVEIEE